MSVPKPEVDSYDYELLDDYVAQVLEIVGWRRAHLARELGVSPSALSKWLLGYRMPSRERRHKLVDILFFALEATESNASVVSREELLRAAGLAESREPSGGGLIHDFAHFRSPRPYGDLVGQDPSHSASGSRRAETTTQATKGATNAALWKRLLGPILTMKQVQRLLRLQTSEEVNELVNQRRLLALPAEHGVVRYPAFQFTDAGEVYPTIPTILEIFDGAVETQYTVASWLQSPKEYLEGNTPIGWLERGRDPDRVIAGAEQAAARLAS
jgi:transcriptional regulator with XRE-family HTH domain